MVQMNAFIGNSLKTSSEQKKGGKNLISDTFLLSHSKSSESRIWKTCKTDFSGLSKPSLSLSLSYFLSSNRNRVVRLSPRASVSVNTDSIKMVFPAQLWRMRKCSISSSTPTNDGFFLSDSIVLLLPFAPLLLIPPTSLAIFPLDYIVRKDWRSYLRDFGFRMERWLKRNSRMYLANFCLFSINL